MTDKMERERFNIKHVKKYVSNDKVNGYVLVIFILLVIITWGIVFGLGASIAAWFKWDFNANSDIFFKIGVCFFLAAKVFDIVKIIFKKVENCMAVFWLAYVLEVSTPLMFVVGFKTPKDHIFIYLSIAVSLLVAIIYTNKIWSIESPKKQEESKTTTTEG
ncbi:hypothetical protein G3341_06630 [Providencia vermicola]|uniref:hypothetical protein n=1 Tax=Providencia vermicola TaxID=333965 RepID=UPI0013A71CB9|nr:hypothetical protein [Providencia vermicola]QIC15400.1 hypothetical protein G3341_06630 [Providencia vermicola]